MSEMKLGDVPISTLNDTDNLIFAEGENIRQYGYGEVKKDILGSESLYDESLSVKEAINKNNASLSEKANQSALDTTNANVALKANDTDSSRTTTSKTVTGSINELNSNKAEKTYVDAKIGSIGSTKTFKGSIVFASLPTSGNTNGDYYYVTDKTSNYCWNGTAWIDIGNNISIGDKTVTGTKTDFMEINNLLNTATVTTGKFLNASNVLSDATYNVTDYIEIDPNKTYTVNYHRLTCYYDANKVFISAQDTGTSSVLQEQNLVIPSNSKYMRTNIAQSLYSSYYIFENTSKYKLNSNVLIKNNTKIDGAIVNPENATFLSKKNLIKDVLLNSNFFLQTDGTNVANTGYTTTDFIPVEQNTIYTMSMHRRTCFYDANKVLLSYFDSGSSVYVDTDIVTPANTAYTKTTIVNTYVSGFYLYKKNNGYFNVNDNIIIPTRLKDKSWATVGDSITWLNGYQPIVKSYLGIGRVINKGQSGWSMVNIYNEYTYGTGTYKTDIDNADIVTLFTCTNDYQLATPLGLITSFDTTTFCGCVNAFLRDVIRAKPTRPILLIATPQRRGLGVWNAEHTVETYDASVQINSLGLYLKDYVDAFVSIAKSYGIPVLNLSEVGGINKYNVDYLTVDGLHPNEAGFKLLAYKIAEFMKVLA